MLPEPVSGASHTLAIVLHARVYRVGAVYYADMPNLLDLLVALRRRAGRVVLCVPTAHVDTAPVWTQQLPADLEVEELPFYGSNVALIRRSPSLLFGLLRVMIPGMRNWDVVAGVAPSAFGMLSVLIALLFRRRVFFLVRGNVLASIRAEHGGLRLRKLLIVGAMRPLDMIARLLIRSGVPTFTFGPALAALYPGPRVHVLRGYARAAIVGPQAPPPLNDPDALRHLLYVGRLTGEKGVDVLIRALSRIVAHGLDVTLTIIGDGAERETLVELCHELRLTDYVTFIRYIREPERLRQHYLAAGVIVVPSRTEGVPGVILEGMALGRAIVASRVGGIPTVLDDGRTGLLAPSENPDALADAIERLIRDPEFAFGLAAEAMAHGRSLTVDSEADTILRHVLPAVSRHQEHHK